MGWLRDALTDNPRLFYEVGADNERENWTAHLNDAWNSESDEGIRQRLLELGGLTDVQLTSPNDSASTEPVESKSQEDVSN
jgi:hypothetical protein